MRELKFRAWDKLNKEMTNFNLFERPTACYGKEVEIMQFTGLKDKFGKEIYEGDIIEWKKPAKENYDSSYGIAEVRWMGTFISLPGAGTDFSEVIGNIYENPELTK